MFDRVLGTYEQKRWNELQDPDEINKSAYPYKGLIRSGAFSKETKTYLEDEYLNDDQGKARTRHRSSQQEESHFQNYLLQKLYAERYEQYI